MIALLTHQIPDPIGWLVSIKLDGCRAVWTGSALVSRTGHDYRPPAWFTAGMPKHRLDGELWGGNGTFAQLVSTIQRRNLNSGQWACIAAEADDLLAVIREQVEREADKKRSEATKVQRAGDDKNLSRPELTKPHSNTTQAKAAELFNTNRERSHRGRTGSARARLSPSITCICCGWAF